jgi:molybdate transport system ATP-binding protein
VRLLLEAVRLPLAPFILEVDAEIAANVTAVFGPSGSGKTSLLEIIAGLRPPESGCVALDGRRLDDAEAGLHVPPRLRRIGYVPQDDTLFPHLSVARNLAYGLKAGARHDAVLGRSRVLDVLELGTFLDRHPDSLSGGEKRRVAFGRALLTSPELLLLDEPLSGIDEALKGRILEYLRRVKATFAIPTLYVTHDAGEVLALADEVLVLERGRIVTRGVPEHVLRS